MTSRLTVEQTRYTPVLRLANAVMGVCQRLGLPFTRIGEAEIIALARKQTGLHDLGDEAFLEGLRMVLDNLESLGMTPLARQALRGTMTSGIVNRLKTQAYLTRHPEVLRIPVERPVFVLGFPRTGTTVLQNLLALADDRRGMQFWELITPVPMHDDPARDIAMRRRRAWVFVAASHIFAPEQKEIHDLRVDTLEECWYLFWNQMQVLNWDLQTGLESYGQWLLQHDMSSAYADYRKHLQVALHREPVEHLVMKCPEHLWFVHALLHEFPDACIIWTHRDPVDSVASYCSLVSMLRRTLYGRFVPKEMGPYVAKRFHEGVTRAMKDRDAWGNEASFFDVNFTDLVADTPGVLKAACEHFQLQWPSDYDARIAEWKEGDREDKRGRHRYSPEAFGVDRKAVREQFQDYTSRFGIDVGHDD